MSLKESLDSYIIFHGPPFVGKSGYFTSELYETYKRISPNELFQMNSALSLRQLINSYIIKPLQEGKKVVVDDNMQTMAVRRSYTDTVLKKIPKIRCTCLTFRPEFGRTQLMWKREILLAEAVLHEDWQSLEKIFANDIDVWYGRCEPVLDVEQLRKFEVTLPLQSHSRHPFQIPCLMIECNTVSDATKIVGLMENWLRQNKHGRVIAIYESDRSNRIEVQKSVVEFLKFVQLSSGGLVVFAYVVDVVSSGDLVLLTTSVLAFLMRLHCLDLFSSNSVYIYESLRHRKMAESVGMRHIKLARALTNPDLLRHGTTQFPIPKMLQSMRVVLPVGETKAKDKSANVPCVPLLEKAVESDNCITKVSVGNHRTLYIAAQNVDTLHRYRQQLLEDREPPPCTVNPSPSNAKPVFAVGRKKRLPSSSFKVLPSWMMRKRRKTADQTLRSVADAVASCSKIRRRQSGIQPSTVYIMTEEELRKTAKMILREGESTDNEKDTSSEIRSLRDRKLVKEEKSESEEENILDEALDRKATRINEFSASEPRLANPRSRERVRHARTSKYSPRTPPQFNASHRLSESSVTNSTRKNAVISTKDSTDDDVCQMFFEGTSTSKSRASSKHYGPTDCTHDRELPKTLFKSALGKESPEAVCSSTQLQVISSSNRSENVTGGGDDDMNFLNEVLTGHVSDIRPCLTNREVNTRSPSEKKSLKKSDSNIYQFFDSLIS